MIIKIVTNNDKILQLTKTIDNIELDFIDGNIKDIIFYCRDLITTGWKLAVDPLAGYISRPNPFRTIVLIQNSGEDNLPEDVIVLEYLLSKYYGQQKEYEYAALKFKDDYSELDFSLVLNAVEGLQKYP